MGRRGEGGQHDLDRLVSLVLSLVGWPAHPKITLRSFRRRQEDQFPILPIAARRDSASRTPGARLDPIGGYRHSPKGCVEVTVGDPWVAFFADSHHGHVDRIACLAGGTERDFLELGGGEVESAEEDRFLGIYPRLVPVTAVIKTVFDLSPFGRDPKTLAVGRCRNGRAGLVFVAVPDGELLYLPFGIHAGEVEVEFVSSRTVVGDPCVSVFVESKARGPIAASFVGDDEFIRPLIGRRISVAGENVAFASPERIAN